MRRFAFRRLAVLLFVFFTVLPASAAPRRDDSNPGFLDRVIHVIRHVLALDDIRPNWPLP